MMSDCCFAWVDLVVLLCCLCFAIDLVVDGVFLFDCYCGWVVL